MLALYTNIASILGPIGAIFISYTIVDAICVLPSSQGPTRILLDECCHAGTALLLWMAGSTSSCSWRDYITLIAIRWKEAALVACTACLIDVDHFIAAGSFRLYDATHLSARPFAHAFLFAVAVPLTIWLLSRNKYAAYVSFMVVCSHQLRDALRRGLWLWPWRLSTPPLPLWLVLVLYGVFIYVLRKVDTAARNGQRHLEIKGEEVV